MADSFGIKLGVEGEKEFKNALRDINQGFKVLGSEMNLVASQFDKQDKSLAAVTARNQVLNKEIDTQKDKVITLEKALQNAASSFGENDKRTKAWQVQLNNASADLNRLERELGDNNKALANTSKEFNAAEKETEQFGAEVKKSADKVDDASKRFEKLGGTLKGIGLVMGTALVAMGAAAVSAGKSLVKMTIGASAYADEILTTATVTGMSTESLQAYKYAAELVDTSLETMTGSMSKQIKAMSNARDGSAKFVEAYAKLGVSVADSNGVLRDSDKVYWETIDALGKVANETERDALAMKIFGKTAQELNPLIAQGSAGIAKLTEEAKRMGMVMSEDALKAIGSFDDSIQRLKGGAVGAKNALGMVLLPQLQLLADDGGKLLGDFSKNLNAAGGDWNKISQVIGDTVGSMAAIILDNLPQLMQLGLDIVLSIGGAIGDNLSKLIDAAVTIVMTLLKGLITALPAITAGALQLVMALLDGIIENLPVLIEVALLMIVTLADGLADALPELIPAIIEAVVLIVNTLLGNMDKLLAAAFKLMAGIAEGLINALPVLIEALPMLITTIIEYFTSNLPLLIELGIALTLQLGIGLIKAVPQLLKQLPKIVSAIITGLSKALAPIGDLGANIIKGLWEGIKSMGNWLSDKINDFFGGVVTGINKFLGIHSPSTVFAGIGSNMGKGLGEGFLQAMNKVGKDMQAAVPIKFSTENKQNVLNSIQHQHSGSIQVQGISDKGQLLGVVDILLEELRKETRR